MPKRPMIRLLLWLFPAAVLPGCQNRPPAGTAGTLADSPELRQAESRTDDGRAQRPEERRPEPAYGGAAPAAADSPVVRIEALDGPHPPTGRPCRIQFRRDALGQ